MSVISEVDEYNGVIMRKVKGELTIRDVMAALEATSQLAGFQPGMGAIWDYSEGTIENFDQTDLRRLVGIIDDWIQTSGGCNYKVAAFAPNDIDYSLSSLYDIFLKLQHVPIDFSVFRTLESAIWWAIKSEPTKA